jgi:predicted metalloprotease with PDZ domain
MEHAYSTAIDVNAQTVKENPAALNGVTAHEFFHLWNVKRIRPQSLEPIDYSKENYTRALWFSEGVTSTAEDFILLRAGLLDEAGFLRKLGEQITERSPRKSRAWMRGWKSIRTTAKPSAVFPTTTRGSCWACCLI